MTTYPKELYEFAKKILKPYVPKDPTEIKSEPAAKRKVEVEDLDEVEDLEDNAGDEVLEEDENRRPANKYADCIYILPSPDPNFSGCAWFCTKCDFPICDTDDTYENLGNSYGSMGDYGDDFQFSCDCGHNPLHTPVNLQSAIYTDTPSFKDSEKFEQALAPETRGFDIVKHLKSKGIKIESDVFLNEKLNDKFIEEKKIIQRVVDGGHIALCGPDFRGCVERINVNNPNIPQKVKNSMIQFIQTTYNAKKDEDGNIIWKEKANLPRRYPHSENKNETETQPEAPDGVEVEGEALYENVPVYKIGIIDIEEFGNSAVYETTIRKGFAEKFQIDLDEEDIRFLPACVPVLVEKKEFHDLVEIINKHWHFEINDNYNGYVKMLFDLIKYFGYNPNDMECGQELRTDGVKTIYNGICRHCKHRVYGRISGD